MDLNNTYYALRHGKTEYQTDSKNNLYPQNSVEQVPLTTAGVKQIRQRAETIKTLNIEEIYSSDLLRTRETAQIVKSHIDFAKEIQFDKRLRDIDFGIWHGKSLKDFYQKFPITKKRFSQRVEEGESWKDVQKRIITFMQEINQHNTNILIISHGVPLWLLEGKIKGWNKDQLVDIRNNQGCIKPAELKKLT